MKNLVRILIAAAIVGVVGFNANRALKIGFLSDFTLAGIEAVAKNEGGDDNTPCYTLCTPICGSDKCPDGSYSTWSGQSFECRGFKAGNCKIGFQISGIRCDGSFYIEVSEFDASSTCMF